MSAQPGTSGLATGQGCAGAWNQQNMGDGEVCFNLPRSLLPLAQASSATSALFLPLKHCSVLKGSFAWAISRWLAFGIWCFPQAGPLGGLYLFCSTSAVKHTTLPSPLPSFSISSNYPKFLIFVLKCELTSPINTVLVLVRSFPADLHFSHCKQQQRELGTLEKGCIGCTCRTLVQFWDYF